MTTPMHENQASQEGLPDQKSVGQEDRRIRALSFVNRKAIFRIIILMVLLCLGLVLGCLAMGVMPGRSDPGQLSSVSEELKLQQEQLAIDLDMLAGRMGVKSLDYPGNLRLAAQRIEDSLTRAGCPVGHQEYQVKGVTCANLIVEIPGAVSPEEIIVVGAHYDTVVGPGADDNTSGVVATMALARRLITARPDRTVRLVFFVNEEPPFFKTELMGSWVYARSCRQQNENIILMISLDSIGYYSEAEKSQHYPFPLGLVYPSKANFIAFVSNLSHQEDLRNVVKIFRQQCSFPSVGGAFPEWVTGIDWSDHWAFWQEGYSAVLVTDMPPFRNDFYHTFRDTVDKIHVEYLARVVDGMYKVILQLAKKNPH